MNTIHHGPRWWVLSGSLMLVMALALGAHFAHLAAGELEWVSILLACLTVGSIGLWIWKNRNLLP